MPNPREALTGADQLRRTSVRSLTPAEENALPQITALTQLYMFTIGAGAGQCGTPSGWRARIPFSFPNWKQVPTNGLGKSGRSRFLRQTERPNGGADQLLDVRLTLRVVDRQSGRSAVAKEGLRFAAELGIEIPSR